MISLFQTTIAESSLKAEEYEWAFRALFLIAGGVIGFVITSIKDIFTVRKLKQEIKKIHTDIVKNASETIIMIQQSRDSYNKACKDCTHAASDLIAAIQGKRSIEEITRSREFFCEIFLEEVIIKFHNYTELYPLVLQSNQKRLFEFASEYVVNELRQYATWLEIINNSKIIKHINKKPAQINKVKLSIFKDVTSHISSATDRDMVNILIDSAINKIIQASDTPIT